MQNLWSPALLEAFAKTLPGVESALIERLYAARLLGQEPGLILHGGGNSSVKLKQTNLFGEAVSALCIKASGFDMANLELAGLPALNLEGLRKLGQLKSMDDQQMTGEVRRQLFDPTQANPSIEALVHAFIAAPYVDHTHADVVLTLTCQAGGQALCEATFAGFVVLPYAEAGFPLALAVKEAVEKHPQAKGLILMHHGIITWGDTAQASYKAMIDAVTLAEEKIKTLKSNEFAAVTELQVTKALAQYQALAPQLRGMLAKASGGKRWVLRPLIEASTQAVVLQALNSLDSGPLTPDHLIRTKEKPVIIRGLQSGDAEGNKAKIEGALAQYAAQYEAYYQRHEAKLSPKLEPFDALPRMILLEGIGALAIGPDQRHAEVAKDILRQTILTKGQIHLMGKVFQGLEEDHLFTMEYRPMQHHKLAKTTNKPLRGRVALVTGAAGAIGSGICAELAEAGAQVVITDLPGDNLKMVTEMFNEQFPQQIYSHSLDVTSEESIQACLDAVIGELGGLDLFVVNAGLAHVSTLEEMDLERFRLLSRVNVDGTLLMLKAANRHFRAQACGGDVVLVSTKNVFSPSASFGAYSATKAASHQLARIASLEMAPLDVRVNMIAPDGVFSDQGKVKSGLWALVGPDRMKARGLDEQGLENYYKDRNLLKTQVTARHCGRAVLYFATRQSPTTGATIPVDGGLPDATPR